jgi:hypothetical protein
LLEQHHSSNAEDRLTQFFLRWVFSSF